MKSALRRLLLLLTAALAVGAGVTCSDGSLTGPRTGGLARLGVMPALTRAATEIFRNLEAFGFAVNNVHLNLRHASGRPALDTVITVTPEQDSVIIQVAVNLEGSAEQLTADVELRDGTTVLFSGTQLITVRAGSGSSARPPIPIDYTGPGAAARTLTVAPHDTAIIAGDSIVFQPTAKDASGQPVTSLALAWSLTDPTRGTVDASGVFKSTAGERGSTYVVARLLSGPKDSAHVVLSVPAAKLAVVAGADQVGVVGQALAQPIVVEVQGADNLPVPFVPVSFTVLSGSGSLSQNSVTADANGRASVALTLGTTAGPNSIQASSAGLTPVVVSASGQPGQATALAIVQQPAATTPSGSPLTTQPSVQVRDAFGNPVAAANIAVTASLTSLAGRTLSGTVTQNTDAGGVATFTDLAISGPVGTTSLTFTQDTLTSVVSSGIAVQVGSAAVVTAVSGSGTGLLKSTDVTLTARVTDGGGNTVPGTDVTFTVTSGGGLLSRAGQPVTLPTAADGTVSVVWTVGTAGSQVVRASTNGVSVDFTAFIAETLLVVQQPTATPQSGVRLAVQPRVQLMDLQGNVVKLAGIAIFAEYIPDAQALGTLSGNVLATTDANGLATWTDLVITGQAPQTGRMAFSESSEFPTIQPTVSALLSLAGGAASVYAPETGDPYSLQDATGGPVTIGVLVTDGFSPVPNATVAFLDARGNCGLSQASVNTDASGIARVDVTPQANYTSCSVYAQPPGGPVTGTDIAYFRVYFAPPGTPTWTGFKSAVWSDPSNWFAGAMPNSGSYAFIPFGWLGLDQYPTPDVDSVTVGTLDVEAGAVLDLNRLTMLTTSDIAVDGIVTNGRLVALGRNGVRALVAGGVLEISSLGQPTVSGLIQADTLEINGRLTSDSDLGFFVPGLLHTTASGMLVQNKGSIVANDAQFEGAFTGSTGTLTILGRFALTAPNCVAPVFAAAPAHVTQIVGDASKDSVEILWDSDCRVGGPVGSTFGTLDITATGGFGAALRTKLPAATLTFAQLVVRGFSSLNVPAAFTLNVGSKGTISADQDGVLRIESALSIPLGLTCNPKPLAPGINLGPFVCTAP